MAEGKPPQRWEIDLCQQATQLATAVLDQDEQVLAAARTRSGLPPILLMIFGFGILGPLIALIWSDAVGRGIVAVTPTKLVLIDTRKRKVTWVKSVAGHRFRFLRKPFVDDKLIVESDTEEVIEVHLPGDWSFLERKLHRDA